MHRNLDKSFLILLIENNPDDALIVSSYLKESETLRFEITNVSRLADGLSEIRDTHPQVILLDMGLPESPRLGSIETILNSFPESCIVVLTSNNAEGLGQQALKAGAQEYLIKDKINPHALEHTILCSYERSLLKARLMEKERELERLSIAVEQTSVAVLITDKKGVIEYVNPQVCQVSGYSKEEMIGQPTSILKSGRHRDQFYKEMYDVISQGGRWKGIFINKAKDGREYFDETSISPFYSSDGNIASYVAVMEDITHRVAIEEELSNKAHILDSIQDAVVGITRQGKVSYWNKAAESLFGYDQTHAVGCTLKELDLCIEDEGRINKDIRKLMREGILNKEYKIKRSDDKTIFIHVNASVLKDSMGLQKGVLGICSDITEEKRLNEKVKQTSRQYENLIANVPGMVFRCGFSKDFPIHFISKGCEILTGFKVSEFSENKSLMLNIVHDDNKDERWNSIRVAAMINESYSLTYRIRTKAGQLRWVMENGNVIKDMEQGERLIEGVVYDYTDPVEARDQLMNTILNTETSERSRISKEIHDGLQQTLTSSFLHFERIKADITQEGGEVLEKYQTGYDLLQKAIQESRSIAHRLLPKVIEDYNLLQSLESLIKEFAGANFNLEFGHNLNREQELDKNIQLVIYRIIQEGLTNVMKYAYAKQVDLQVFVYSDQVILTLEDDGCGFDTIKSVDNSFGLISMKSRAAAVGGFVQIDSRPGIGTNILLVVPLNEDNEKGND